MELIIIWTTGILITYLFYGFVWWYETRRVKKGKHAIFLRHIIPELTNVNAALFIYIATAFVIAIWPMFLFIMLKEYWHEFIR